MEEESRLVWDMKASCSANPIPYRTWHKKYTLSAKVRFLFQKMTVFLYLCTCGVDILKCCGVVYKQICFGKQIGAPMVWHNILREHFSLRKKAQLFSSPQLSKPEEIRKTRLLRFTFIEAHQMQHIPILKQPSSHTRLSFRVESKI